MKISARNRFSGTVAEVRQGAVNSEVVLDAGEGVAIVGVITNESVGALGLRAGAQATALIKASSVLVMTDAAGARLSARNQLAGKVAALRQGPVSVEVTISLPCGDSICATITRDAAEELGLAVGVPATAVFKAPSVIFAVGA